MNNVYYRTQQAANYLEVSNQTFYKMIRNGVFKTVRLELSRGCGGKRAYEVALSELKSVKDIRDKKRNKHVVVEQPVVEAKQPLIDTEMVKMLEDLECTFAWQADLMKRILQKVKESL